MLTLLLSLVACGGPSSSDDKTTGDSGVHGLDADGDGYGASTDCDDESALIHPGADEVCDGLDNDCDDEADEDPVDGDTYYADADADTHGDAAAPVAACSAPAGTVTRAGDCDDTDTATHPGAAEDCDDTVDHNCDGSVAFEDADGDGWAACLECDDADATAHPDGVEVCDAANADEDCSGLADDLDAGVDAATKTTWYRDPDRDGYGDPTGATQTSCDSPVGYVADATDCDSLDATVNPGVAEVCDAIDADEDCSGLADDADAGVEPDSWIEWHPDEDGDGYGEAGGAVFFCDAPAGFVADLTDCADLDATINPAAVELCDTGGTDEDCDGAANDADPSATGTSAWFADVDLDGYGDPDASVVRCESPTGYLADATDCDDSAPTTNPGASEVCDTADVDEDCDGRADDATATGQTTFYADGDGDGYGGASAATVSACDAPIGYASVATDCDDDAATAHPGAAEVCDDTNLDEDCNGVADDADSAATGRTAWYRDGDGDGYGTGVAVSSCDVPTGYAADNGDCDDASAAENPSAVEVCNGGVDDDCDGSTDDADASITDATTWYRDVDGDGYGGTTTRTACAQPSGFREAGGDCNDANTSVSPGTAEVCDASEVDEDCDGAADDADASVTHTTTWYLDADADGFGAATSSIATCSAPPGYVEPSTDCNDGVAAISPAGVEACNGADDDCDGTVDDGVVRWYPDYDGDGYGDSADTGACAEVGGYVTNGDDCDEADEAIHPGAAEVCDSIDNDCDGTTDDDDADIDGTEFLVDADEDGYGDDDSDARIGCVALTGETTVPGDCDDGDRDVNPGETEHYGDSIDDDCDGSTSGGSGKTVVYGSGSGSYVRVTSSETYSDVIFRDYVIVTGSLTCYRCYFEEGMGLDLDGYSRGDSASAYIYDSFFERGINATGAGVYSTYTYRITLYVYNSTFFEPYDYAVEVSDYLYSQTDAYIYNSVVYNPGTGDYYEEYGANITTSSCVTYASETAGILDFSYDPPRPSDGSPLIGASGTSPTGTDYWGVTRTDPDIGAVEY